MKLNENLELKSVMGQDLLLDSSGKFGGIVKLNETGAFIWAELSQGKDAAEIADRISERFEVSKEQALSDIEEFCEALKAEGLAEA